MTMKSIYQFLLLASFLVLTSACASMSTLQTGRTLKPGEAQSTFGGGIFQSSEIATKNAAGVTNNSVQLSLPYLEYTYRQGINDKFDAGFKATLIGTLSVDAKYSLYADEKFAAAVGLGAGYMSYSADAGAGEKNEYKIIDVMLPFILSYDFTPKISAYTSPRYLQRTISGASSSSTGLAGAAIGLKLGQTSGAFVEVASYKDTSSSYGMTQANFSWFWAPSTWF